MPRPAAGHCWSCKGSAVLAFWSWSTERRERVGWCERHEQASIRKLPVDEQAANRARILNNHRGTKVRPLPETATRTVRADQPLAMVRSSNRTSRVKAQKMWARMNDAQRKAEVERHYQALLAQKERHFGEGF